MAAHLHVSRIFRGGSRTDQGKGQSAISKNKRDRILPRGNILSHPLAASSLGKSINPARICSNFNSSPNIAASRCGVAGDLYAKAVIATRSCLDL
jgi:hypothetical protein